MTRETRIGAIDWKEFCETLDAAKTVVVSGHVRPDGDAIGSALALKWALGSLGKEVLAIDGSSLPRGLEFVDREREVRKVAELSEAERAFVKSADVLVLVDVSSTAQLGPDASELFKTNVTAKLVVVDHHAVGDEMGDVRCVDPTADSAGSLVFDAIRALGVAFTPKIAEALFLAISTDTGWFRFESTKAETLRRAADLLDAGVKIDYMYRELFERESFGRYRLLGIVASTCERFLDGKGAFLRLSQCQIADAGAKMEDCEDLVNTPLCVAGMEVSVIAVEQPDGTTKASFRSRNALDCAKLAKEFGGGGHARAAGATLNLPLEEACQALKEKVVARYSEL